MTSPSKSSWREDRNRKMRIMLREYQQTGIISDTIAQMVYDFIFCYLSKRYPRIYEDKKDDIAQYVIEKFIGKIDQFVTYEKPATVLAIFVRCRTINYFRDDNRHQRVPAIVGELNNRGDRSV